jgi:hypothetical protein
LAAGNDNLTMPAEKPDPVGEQSDLAGSADPAAEVKPEPPDPLEPPDPVEPPDPDARQWALRASNAPFEELAATRANAEQWRNGLAGLTALLSAGALIASPGLADHVLSPWRWLAGLLALAGLLSLLYGTWRAMNASFGVAGKEIVMTGENLRDWERNETKAAVKDLGTARKSFAAGMLLIIAAAAAAYIATPSGDDSTVQVASRAGTFCGQILTSRPGTIAIQSADGELFTIPASQIIKVQPVSNC